MADLPLEDLRLETFEPHVGSRFDVTAGDGTLAFDLTDTRALGAARPGYARAPFGLTFRGAGPQKLPQAIYRLEHPALGALEIFLVPIGRDGDGFLYEAIFT